MSSLFPTQIADRQIKEIGFLPGQGSTYEIGQLTDKLTSSHFNFNALTKLLVMEHLSKQGLPPKALSASTASSLASAYGAIPYLRAWRNRVNPNWALLGGTGDDDDGDDSDSSAEKFAPPPKAPTTTPTSQAAPASEAWLKALFSQIEGTVARLVTVAIAEGRVKLDEGAKGQIRLIATESADKIARDIAELTTREILARELPPRQIEIITGKAGTNINLGLQHEKFPTLLRAAQARDHRGFCLNIWLTGPTGSGKTTAAENVAKALTLPFGTDGSLDADYKVLGFRNAQGEVVSTQFLDIYANGGIYVADEIDNWLPSALLSLNSALANGFVSSPGGLIPRHPNACVIACANTWGHGATNDYIGRAKQDAAALDRFQPKIDWPVDIRLERAVAEAQAGTVGKLWHDVILAARVSVAVQGVKIIISPRATFSGLALLGAGFAIDEVCDMTFLAGLSPEQRRPLLTATAAAKAALAAQLDRELAEQARTLTEPEDTTAPIELLFDPVTTTDAAALDRFNTYIASTFEADAFL